MLKYLEYCKHDPFDRHTKHNTLMRVLFLSVVTLSWGQGAYLRVLGNLDRIYNLDVDWVICCGKLS